MPSPSTKTNRWLEVVKQNSWEMELLLTGFVLIGLVRLPDVMELYFQALVLMVDTPSNLLNNLLGIPFIALDAGIRIITMNLILLLLLRGFWIGMVGLSSVYEKGIQPAKLNFSQRFKRNLQARRFDTNEMVIRLDKLCSSIFALSFLFLFISISGGLFFLEAITPESIYNLIWPNPDKVSTFQKILRSILVGISLIYLFFGLLKVIDFLSVGALKSIKWRWFARPYYYISQFISYATLGHLYRSIYYSFATNMRKGSLRWILIGYSLLVLILMFDIQYSSEHIYYPDHYLGKYEITYTDYEGLNAAAETIIVNPTIQSDVIRDNHVRLFIPYLVMNNRLLTEYCPDLVPIREQGLGGRINFGRNNRGYTEEDVERALDCFNSFYRISIDDSLYTDLTYRYYRQPRERGRGILTYIPITHLRAGFHTLQLEEALDPTPNQIQFWKE